MAIHRVIYGSLERFIGLLIEHYAGSLPLWLSPVQVKILPISRKQNVYAKKVMKELGIMNQELRIELDDRDESIGKKIREASMQKIPYQIIVGEKEAKSAKGGSVSGGIIKQAICGLICRFLKNCLLLTYRQVLGGTIGPMKQNYIKIYLLVAGTFLVVISLFGLDRDVGKEVETNIFNGYWYSDQVQNIFHMVLGVISLSFGLIPWRFWQKVFIGLWVCWAWAWDFTAYFMTGFLKSFWKSPATLYFI